MARVIYRHRLRTAVMDSILSTEEREVAAALAAGRSVAAVAATRDTSEAAVERAAARIREKTDRALATLLASPFAAEAVTALDADQRADLRELFAA